MVSVEYPSLLDRASTASARLNKLASASNCHRVAQLVQCLTLAVDGIQAYGLTNQRLELLEVSVENAEDYLKESAKILFRRWK